jgi:cell division topological specificity factor MinE
LGGSEVFNSLAKLFGNSHSKQKAKSRLHFVLVQDRTGLTGEQMTEFKEELMQVIERFFVVDKTGFDVSYKREDGSTTLLINSPLVVHKNAGVGKSLTSSKTGVKIQTTNKEVPVVEADTKVSANQI